MNTTSRIVFGFVTQPINERGFGIAVVDDFNDTGKPKSVSLLVRNGPVSVEASEIEPYMNGQFMPGRPAKGDTVGMVLTVGEDGVVRAPRWCLGRDWETAMAKVEELKRTNPSRSAIFMARLRKGTAIAAKLANNAGQKSVQSGDGQQVSKEPRPFKTVLFSTACHA